MTSLTLATTKIVAEVDDGIGWVTFNQPEKRNAMSIEMWQGLGDALEAFHGDDDVRVVVMKGAGGQAFVSGADISEFDQHRATAEQKAEYGTITGRGNKWLRKLDKPLIAMIHGYCIGGGLATPSPRRRPHRDAGFRVRHPGAKLGLGYDYGGLARSRGLLGRRWLRTSSSARASSTRRRPCASASSTASSRRSRWRRSAPTPPSSPPTPR
jgi:enoyl-CoA hydratase/carnithine racemase